MTGIVLGRLVLNAIYHNYVFATGPKSVKKGSPYSITEGRVPELIPVLGIQPGLLPILLLGKQRHNGCEQFA